ncbi:MAG: muconolactone Delta-isomerase family protein [Actinomycetota bacterium]
MLYLVNMTVHPPPEPDEDFHQRVEAERELALRLQREGTWVHLWRVVGRYENYSVFDVDDHDQLHAILMSLPLAPYLEHVVTPLATHPSALGSAAYG